MSRGERGFSLIELMVTVAIVGVLAAIAVPSWGMMVAKSRQVEAKAGLDAIHMLEVAFQAEHNRYGSLAEIGFVNEGQARYGYMLRNEPGGFIPPSQGMDLGGSDFTGLFGGGGDLGEGFGDDGGGGGYGKNDYGGGGGDDLCGTCNQPGWSGDDDDDGRGGRSQAALGNPHYDLDSFEAVAVGIVSRAAAPHDLDVWMIDQHGVLENINVGY